MKNNFESFNDNNLPVEAVLALRSGKTIIRQIMNKPLKADGTPSSHPIRIQTQGLKSRKVSVSGGVAIGALLNSSGANGNSLEIVNATNWLAINKETFMALFGDIFDESFAGYNVLDGDDVISADILNPNGVEISVNENFVPERAGDSPKTKGIGGETVTASFSGRELPVYRHTSLVVKGSTEDFFIDPNSKYTGNMEAPVLAVPATAGVGSVVNQG